MDGRQHGRDLDRLGIAAFLVVLGVFVALRLLAVPPWTFAAFDVYAYWLAGRAFDYATAQPGATGAFLYSPAFAQAISPLAHLPWPIFAGLWTAALALPLGWLTGRWALPILLLPPVAMSVSLGQLDLAFAVVAIAGLRWPGLWAIPLLTKVSPGVGVLWFAVRREWRSLGWALGVTGVIVAASFAVDPQAWRGWIAMLARSEFPKLGGTLWFVPIPLVLRLPAAAALVVWGARSDRRWVLPLATCLAMPTIWLNSPTILVGLLPLAAAGARTPAGVWLRASRPERPAAARPAATPPVVAPPATALPTAVRPVVATVSRRDRLRGGLPAPLRRVGVRLPAWLRRVGVRLPG